MQAARAAMSREEFAEGEREAGAAGEWIRGFIRGTAATEGEFHPIETTKFGRFCVNLNRVLFDGIIAEVSRIRAEALRRQRKWNESIGRNGGNVEP